MHTTALREAQAIRQELTAELTVLDAAALRLWIDEYEDLVVDLDDGEPPRAVSATRCYPITHPTQWIVLHDGDQEEIGLIADAADLPADSRKALESELQRTYILPRITAIHEIVDRHSIPAWRVDTDRAPRELEIASSRRDIRFLGEGRVLIRDAEGNHFEIPDYRRLDAESRDLLDTQV